MRLRILAVTLVALVALVAAAPAHAQGRWNEFWDTVENNSENLTRGFAEGLGRGLCQQHSINGVPFDQVGESWCNGMVYGSQGQLENCNANAVNPDPDCPRLLRRGQDRDDDARYQQQYRQRRPRMERHQPRDPRDDDADRSVRRPVTRRHPRVVSVDRGNNDRPGRQPQRVGRQQAEGTEYCNRTPYPVLVVSDDDEVLGQIAPGQYTLKSVLPKEHVVLSMGPADLEACTPTYGTAGNRVTVTCN